MTIKDDLQRYDLEEVSTNPYESYRDMVKRDYGEWVRFDDISEHDDFAAKLRRLEDGASAIDNAAENLIGKIDDTLAAKLKRLEEAGFFVDVDDNEIVITNFVGRRTARLSDIPPAVNAAITELERQEGKESTP
jgi:hypothetical protein